MFYGTEDQMVNLDNVFSILKLNQGEKYCIELNGVCDRIQIFIYESKIHRDAEFKRIWDRVMDGQK